MLESCSASSSLFSARQQYDSSRSIPTYLRPSFLATTEVVPEPKKGSRTTLPGFELARTSLATSFSGFCVGWSVFSGIDQKGTVMSVHRFEGCVNRKLPSDAASQSFGLP